MDDFLQLFSIPSTATLTTVLKRRGLNNAFMRAVQPLRADARLAGVAFTLRYLPTREDLAGDVVDNLKDVQRIGIERIAPGEVLVIDARGETGAGTLGNILATRLQVKAAAGIVTDGAYRDSPSIAKMEIAAYAAAMNANSSKTIHHPSEIQVPIACGGVAVFPGDIVVGDGEGVVVVPRYMAEEVAREAVEQEEMETFILEKIEAGASIVGAYPMDAATLSEFDTWKKNKNG
jgi:regulator of RNase E activity RraA